ncbi:hypothetical protein D3C87_2171890 [compost metagenome]
MGYGQAMSIEDLLGLNEIGALKGLAGADLGADPLWNLAGEKGPQFLTERLEFG